MDKPKQVCWNCCHCDTFGGVCFKGKFVDFPRPVILSAHGCDEFDDRDIFFVMGEEIGKLKEENKMLKDALYKCNEERTWCYDCKCAMGNLVFGIRHGKDCEYIRLMGGNK